MFHSAVFLILLDFFGGLDSVGSSGLTFSKPAAARLQGVRLGIGPTGEAYGCRGAVRNKCWGKFTAESHEACFVVWV